MDLNKLNARKREPQNATPESVVQLVEQSLEDAKAINVKVIDVRGKTAITDYMVVASGSSTRHVKTLAEQVSMNAKRDGLEVLGMEGQSEAEWVLVDLADVIVHVMLPKTRDFYNIENLWSVDGESTGEEE